MQYQDNYLPVDPDFLEMVEKMTAGKKASGKIHYFEASNQIGLAEGDLKGILKNEQGEFLIVKDQQVRMDKIITLLGKPGPAYETYDRYANACLTCEDLGQF